MCQDDLPSTTFALDAVGQATGNVHVQRQQVRAQLRERQTTTLSPKLSINLEDSYVDKVHNKVKGSLKRNAKFWHQIGANKFVLDTIENGYVLP